MTTRFIGLKTLIGCWVLLMLPPLAAASGQGTILVLGDSISAAYGIQRESGWVNLLQKRLDQRDRAWQVINASISGETTGGGLARLPATLSEHDPDVVIIELGGNDALRGYPVTRIRSNLTELVRLAKDGAHRVLLVGMQIPPNYGPRYTRDFRDLFADVAQAEQVDLVPFFLENVALRPELMQSDGIHPTAAAQPLLLEEVWPHLEPLLSGRLSGRLSPAASTPRPAPPSSSR
jgi:acyl-CoA thioesterase-1